MQRETHGDIKIEAKDAYELPDRTRGGESKYPVKALKVGESFFVATDKIAGVRNTIAHTAKVHGIAVECRKTTHNGKPDGEPGLRVWRVADRHPSQEPSKKKAGKA